jgi:hypothetical protein
MPGETENALDLWNVEGKPSQTERRLGRLGWLALAAVGVLVFEMTANPALAVSVSCLKFGWDGFITARWLWRVDSIRVRGRVVAISYAASSLWLVVGVAFLFVLIFTLGFHPLLEAMRRRGARVPSFQTEITTAGLVMLIGSVVANLTSTFAIFAAGWSGISVWIGPEASFARKSGHWPPSRIPGRATYRAHNRSVGMETLTMISTAIELTVLIGVFAVADAMRVHLPAWQAVTLGVLILLFAVDLIVILLILVGAICPTICASAPEECWPPSYQSPIIDPYCIERHLSFNAKRLGG